MDLNNKLAVLDQIYQIHDNFVSGLELACRKHCVHCCTTGVTLTTVEGYKIEHMDDSGCTGNLLDMLGVMAAKENRRADAEGKLNCRSAGLIANQPLKVLMIPPQHRTKMEPILQSLLNISI